MEILRILDENYAPLYYLFFHYNSIPIPFRRFRARGTLRFQPPSHQSCLSERRYGYLRIYFTMDTINVMVNLAKDAVYSGENCAMLALDDKNVSRSRIVGLLLK